MNKASFSVLIVCTANQCRSPMAELLLARSVTDRDLDWRVDSAGTHARTGEPVHPRAAQALAVRAIDSASWRSRRLTVEAIDAADLILAAASIHRRVIVGVRPQALPRTFLFREFVRLRALVHDNVEEPVDVIAAVRRQRAHTVAASPGADNIPDPIGKSQRRFERCCAELAAGVDIMTGAGPSSGTR